MNEPTKDHLGDANKMIGPSKEALAAARELFPRVEDAAFLRDWAAKIDRHFAPLLARAESSERLLGEAATLADTLAGRIQEMAAKLKELETNQNRDIAEENRVIERILDLISKAGIDVTDCDGEDDPASIVGHWCGARMKGYMDECAAALAACAEIRAALDIAVGGTGDGWETAEGEDVSGQINAALSSTAGTGWRSPEEWERRTAILRHVFNHMHGTDMDGARRKIGDEQAVAMNWNRVSDLVGEELSK